MVSVNDKVITSEFSENKWIKMKKGKIRIKGNANYS